MDAAAGVFSYCTRCGLAVGAYPGREWRGDFPDDDDMPVADADRADKRPTDYWCPRCRAVWRALDVMETGYDRACGHFMPCNVRFCGVCGREE